MNSELNHQNLYFSLKLSSVNDYRKSDKPPLIHPDLHIHVEAIPHMLCWGQDLWKAGRSSIQSRLDHNRAIITTTIIVIVE